MELSLLQAIGLCIGTGIVSGIVVIVGGLAVLAYLAYRDDSCSDVE